MWPDASAWNNLPLPSRKKIKLCRKSIKHAINIGIDVVMVTKPHAQLSDKAGRVWEHSKTHFREEQFFCSVSCFFFFIFFFCPQTLSCISGRDRNSDFLTTYELDVTFCSQLTRISSVTAMWGGNNGQLTGGRARADTPEHCTLFRLNGNACFPTRASDTKTCSHNCSLKGSLGGLCNPLTIPSEDQRTSFCQCCCCWWTPTESQETWRARLSGLYKKDKDCVLLEQRYPTSPPGPMLCVRLATG